MISFQNTKPTDSFIRYLRVENNNTSPGSPLGKELTQVIIQIAVIGFLVVGSYKIVSPFIGILLWGLVLAVSLHPLHRKLVKKLGGKEGQSATIIVLCGILLIGVPSVLMGLSTVNFAEKAGEAVKSGIISIKPPPASVSGIPAIGNKLSDMWTQMSVDMPAWLEKYKSRISEMVKRGVNTFISIASGLFMFSAALIIAGVMLAYGEAGSAAIRRIFLKLVGNPAKGDELYNLSIATIRSVAIGVIGVALIQALLLAVGFMLADIPAAGLLAILVLILGILQLPALLVSLPVIAYLWWSGDSTMSNVIFTLYFLVAGMADNFLKPLLLGRNVDAPMPVILIGAIGGMLSAGLIGLFVGAVLLALGYVIFMEWVGGISELEAAPPETNLTESAQAPSSQ
ncbi:MAG: AI-2E family transporter [Gammaproteobacteria bacterium]|jgi:predicted PurR-regulated permease PerM